MDSLLSSRMFFLLAQLMRGNMDSLLSSRMFVLLAQLMRGNAGRCKVPHFWPGIAIAEYYGNVPYFDGSAIQVMLASKRQSAIS